LQKYSADAIRVFVLSSYYRSPLTYSEEALEAAERGAERLRQAVRSESRGEKEPTGEMTVESYQNRFIEAMDDDFSTPRALATMFDLAHDINRLSEAGYGVNLAQKTLLDMARVLGLTLKPPEMPTLDANPFIELLISTRERLREAKQWQLADEIRNKLGDMGISLEDTPQGTIWKIKR
jgi:cysteinyl-tRNA synthetase